MQVDNDAQPTEKPAGKDGIWVFVLAALPCLIGLGVMVAILPRP